MTELPVRRLSMSVAASIVIHLTAASMLSMPGGAGRFGVERADFLTVVLRNAKSEIGAEPDMLSASRDSRTVESPSRATHVERDASLLAPIVAEPRYYALGELDVPPVVLRDIPADPPELRDYPEGGKLVMQLWIDDDGHVAKVENLSSDLPQAFADSARDSFMRSVFAPGRKDGAAVRSRVRIEVHYRPGGAG